MAYKVFWCAECNTKRRHVTAHVPDYYVWICSKDHRLEHKKTRIQQLNEIMLDVYAKTYYEMLDNQSSLMSFIRRR